MDKQKRKAEIYLDLFKAQKKAKTKKMAQIQPDSLMKIHQKGTNRRELDAAQQGDGKKKLILHFDINSMLIKSDLASKGQTEQMINSFIAESAWGKVNLELQVWELLSPEISSYAPDPSPDWMTFNEYLKNVYKPEPVVKRIAMQHFTEPGMSGEDLRPTFERIAAAFRLPIEEEVAKTKKYKVTGEIGCMVRESPSLNSPKVKRLNMGEVVEATCAEPMYADHPLVVSGRRVRLVKPVKGYASLYAEEGYVILTPEAKAGDQIEEKGKQELPFFPDGNVIILPSFFNFLVYLQEQERDFSLVFRRFGSDLLKDSRSRRVKRQKSPHLSADFVEIVKVFNAFCEGRHPMYPYVVMDGTNGTKDRRLKIPTNTGKFYRNGSGSDQMHLAMINPEDQSINFHHGNKAIWEVISTKAAESITLGLCDDFEWWRKNGESVSSGKLHFVEREGDRTLSLFFDKFVDSYCSFCDRLVVDVRDAHTGNRLGFASKSNDRNVFKTDPFSAIANPNYFVDALEYLED